MSISSVGTNSYLDINGLTSPSASKASAVNVPDALAPTSTSQTESSTSGIAGNNSELSSAVRQALAQLNAGAGLSSLLTSDSQQPASDFMSNLINSLPGLSSSSSSSANSLSDLFGNSFDPAPAPITLDQSSSTIKLQTSIQNLITQLDGNSSINNLFGSDSDSNTSSGLQNLQQSFNTLLTASNGNPTQTTLQSFLKTVATNIESSASIGNLFDASA
jgi:hypothetical protein